MRDLNFFREIRNSIMSKILSIIPWGLVTYSFQVSLVSYSFCPIYIAYGLTDIAA